MLTWITLGMGSASERRCYIVTPRLIGWAHTQSDLRYVMAANEEPWDLYQYKMMFSYMNRNPQYNLCR